jgi:NitT/TauT family transport system permease protein
MLDSPALDPLKGGSIMAPMPVPPADDAGLRRSMGESGGLAPRESSPRRDRVWIPARLRDPRELRHGVLAVAGSLLLAAALLGLWQWYVTSKDISPAVFPSPEAVWDSFLADVRRGIYWDHIRVTLKETLIGFLLGSALGIVLGVLIAEVRLARSILLPYVIAFQAIPKVALAPLFLIWFGFGLTSKIALATSITFFPVLVNVAQGVSSSDPDQIQLLRAFCASRWQVLVRVKLPAALPYLFAALEIAIVLSVIAAIIAEFVGSTEGMGYLILLYNNNLNVAAEFAAIGVLAAVTYALHIVVRVAGRRAVFWTDLSKREVPL